MDLPFLKSSDPRLTQVSPAVPVDAITSPETRQTLDYLYSLAHSEQADPSKAILVGVSASQVGIQKRIVLVDVAADGHGSVGQLKAFINPVITHFSADSYDWYEGCYSTAPICGVVSRARQITIEAYNPDGQPIRQRFEGYVARVFQHEIDHLDGKVFIDRITNPNHLHWVKSSDYPKYRDKEGWRNWPHLCPRSRWDDIRNQGHDPLPTI